MAVELSQYVHLKTGNRMFLNRLCTSIRSISKEQGYCKGALYAIALAIGTLFTATFSYFTIEGSVRSIIDVVKGTDSGILRIRPIGDAGGWTSLAIFSLIALGTMTMQLVREGEFWELRSICRGWIEENQLRIQEDPESFKNLYGEIVELLDCYSRQVILSKSVITRKTIALDIFREHEIPQQGKIFRREKKIENLLLQIKEELDNIRASKQYLSLLCDGQQALRKRGFSKQAYSLILGLVIPIILFVNGLLSAVGQFGLGKELFIDRHGLTDVGHFGEWPFNAVEAVAMAFFLHLWCMVNEGDFVRKRKVYERHLNTLLESRSRHNRLVEIANQELTELSGECYQFKLPIEYYFKKI